MPSSWTHAAFAITAAASLMPRDRPRWSWPSVAIAVVVLDVDALPRLWGGGDLMWLGGHRALTHSLPFALALGAVLTMALARDFAPRVWLALAAAIATHGALDALASYGEGVQFFAPFIDARYKSSWLPLGDGVVRDTVAFCLAYIVGRSIIRHRWQPAPRPWDPSLVRKPSGNRHD